jgi:hypothetical protein
MTSQLLTRTYRCIIVKLLLLSLHHRFRVQVPESLLNDEYKSASCRGTLNVTKTPKQTACVQRYSSVFL